MKEIDVPAGLVAELALGREDPTAVAERFGISGKVWEELQQWPPFIAAVESQRAAYEKEGYSFRVKAAMMADVLLDQVFVKAQLHETTLLQKMEALKTLAKYGELEPTQKVQAAGGPSFSITIDLGSAALSTTANTPRVEIKSSTSSEVEDAIEVPSQKLSQSEPSVVTDLPVPGFDMEDSE